MFRLFTGLESMVVKLVVSFESTMSSIDILYIHSFNRSFAYCLASSFLRICQSHAFMLPLVLAMAAFRHQGPRCASNTSEGKPITLDIDFDVAIKKSMLWLWQSKVDVKIAVIPSSPVNTYWMVPYWARMEGKKLNGQSILNDTIIDCEQALYGFLLCATC